ncbi:SMC-Scp complex subunit ScpB [Candidatus Woesearchaeota archaeon]|nr:SMC-Scp complex subunit ScpB [Candidatus Woesearchaeota archaeon]
MELKKEVESLLFSSGKVMKEKELAELTNHSEKEVKEALESLKKDYDERDTSLFLMQTGDSWKLNVREKYLSLVTKIVADTELPFPILETLGIIAFKAPAWQADIVKSRGTNAYEHVGLLVDEGFVEKKKEGRSFRLTLTPKFFQYFEVAGHDAMKEALKDIKEPEPKKIGELKVVDLPPEEVKKEEEKEKNKLGEFEVVDVPPAKPKETIDTITPDNGFLDDIDKKIAEMSKKNDEYDEDESFKMPVDELHHEGEAQGQASQEAGEFEKSEEPAREENEREEVEAEEGDEESDEDNESEEEKENQ